MIMKNDKKKIGFSPTKKIFSAAAMLAVSASMLATSTYAWFSMNTQVTATGMQMKAKAEGGIVIAAKSYTKSSVSNSTVTDATYAAAADTAYSNTAAITLPSAELYPTSTVSGLSHWYHAASNAVNNYAASGGYQVLDTLYDLKTDGIAYEKTGTKNEVGQYYLLDTFQVKATDAATYGLWLSGITITKSSPSGTSGSENLNKSLRIAIKANSNTYFFAPNYTTGTLYYYSGTARTAWESTAINLGTSPNKQISTNITSTPTDVEVFIYYEGEDENCKSINAVNIDNLTVDLTFTSVDPSSS
jgi:hypothetical protein